MDDAELDASEFGVGEFPRVLDRLNWGAVLLPGAWAVLYNLWAWAGLLLAIQVALSYLPQIIQRYGPGGALGLLVFISVSLIAWVPTVVFGFQANHLLWKREAARRAGKVCVALLVVPESVGAYSKGQRTWVKVGLALLTIASLWQVLWIIVTVVLQASATWELAIRLAAALVPLALLWLFDRYRSRSRTQGAFA